MYGGATDLLGLIDDPTGLAEGREIYRRIFTTDAKIITGTHPIPDETTPLRTGPDEWADYVTAALGERYRTTQHLIGTQVARVDEMPDGLPGGATRQRDTPQVGWQIYKMNLTTVSVETRSLTA